MQANYIQLEMCTLLHKTTLCVTIEYGLANVYCIIPDYTRIIQDAIHHVVQIDKSVQITTASCKKGPSWYVCFPPNTLYEIDIPQRTLRISSQIM